MSRESLIHSDLYPYDAPDSWWNDLENPSPPPPSDWAHRAARGIIANLQDRHTIKNGFYGVDETTRREIVATLAEIIRLAESEKAT